MIQPNSLQDPVIELIEKYLKKVSTGKSLDVDNNAIDHTHLFESDEPPLLKPYRLKWGNGKLLGLTMGVEPKIIDINLTFVKGILKSFTIQFPDGVIIPYELIYGTNGEQKGKLIEVI